MEIKLHEITVREIYDGYKNNYGEMTEEDVMGYHGRLNIRPKYQRNYVYKDKQRDAVIDTVRKDFPLNVMYWAKTGKNDKNEDTYEVLDGQQRTISICEYVDGKFSINFQYFHSLPKDQQEQILGYKLMVYLCEGTDSEKLDWFKVVNIAGEKLSDQELRNAIYTGEWLNDAKRYFSKNNCAAYGVGKDYLNGDVTRQAYLETAIKWLSEGNIEEYMSKHQHEPNANELWLYFQSVINWVRVVFPKYRKEMRGIEWGYYYNEYKNVQFDSNKLEEQIQKYIMDEDVTSKKGIYEYLIDGKLKHLSIREFSPNQKREAYERQKGICQKCNNHFEFEEMEGDHITPWSIGGKTTAENCQMLCRECNRRKSNN